MVRFHWPSSGGQNAFVPHGGIEEDEEYDIMHVSVEMEVRACVVCAMEERFRTISDRERSLWMRSDK